MNNRSTSGSESIIANVVDEFTERLNRGEKPDLDEYTRRYPSVASALRRVLETLVLIRDPHADLGEMSVSALGQLGDFRVIRELGRGGMGVVYIAEQISLGRRVALKVLPFAALLDERHMQRFHNEARAAAMLRHPNIVTVHAVGHERGVHFYAMELIEGNDLAEVIEAVRQSEDAFPASSGEFVEDEGIKNDIGSPHSDLETTSIAALSTQHSHHRRDFYRSVARLGIQAAQSLQYAHQCGIVHRDIKPSNLLINRTGQLWVTDFGLAMNQGDDGLTLTGDLIGTLRYMSPEQASGNQAVIDHRTDIYSLGASLYELLTLHPAFEGRDRQALLRQIDEKDARRPRHIDESIPRDLETIIMKAMAKEPHERYASAGKLAEDLQRFVELKPIRARRSTRAHKLSRWAKRNPVLAIAIAVASLLTILLAVGGPLAALRQSQLVRDVEKLAEQRGTLVQQERVQREQKSRLAQQFELQNYDLRIEQAHTAIFHHEFERAATILKHCVPGLGGEDHRSFEWYHLWWSCQRVLNVPTITSPHSLRCASYSPNGRYLALANWSGTVALHDAESLDLVWDSDRVRSSPEVFSDRGGYEGHGDMVTDLAFTHDSELLITGSRDKSIKIWHVETGKQLLTKSFADSDIEVSSLAISSDGQTLATGFSQPDQASREPIHISLWRLDRSAPGVTLKPHPVDDLRDLIGRVSSIAISRNGSFLAASSRDGGVRIWDLKNGQPLPSLKGHSGIVRVVEFSPTDNNLLASGSYEESATEEGAGEITLWNIRDGSAIETWRKHSHTRCLAFSPDGSQLAAGDYDGLVRIWNVDPLELSREFPAHSRRVNDITFSPDGESMLSVSHDQTAKIWSDLKLADEPTRLIGHGASVLRLAVSHNSRLLLSAGNDGFAKLWDVRTGQQKGVIEPESRVEHIMAGDFSPDDSLIALGGGFWRNSNQPLEFFVWDLKRQHRNVLFSAKTSDRNGSIIGGAAFNGDRVAAGIGREIYIWNVHSGEHLKTLSGHTQHVHDVAWSARTNRIASLTMGHTHELKLWDAKSGELLATLPVPDDGSNLFRLAFSPNGQTLAVGTSDGDILLFDVIHRPSLRRLEGHTDNVWDVAFSPDGLRLASASQDHSVKLWNLDTGTALLTFREPRSVVWSVCFSPDGRALIGTSDHLENSVIHVWRAATPEEAAVQLHTRHPAQWTGSPSDAKSLWSKQ